MAGPTLAQKDAANTPAAAFSAQEILDAVVARLPQERLNIRGNLLVRKLRGVVAQELHFDMLLDWGASPATACYTIRDNFGGDLEQLTLSRAADGRLDTTYFTDGTTPAPTPPLTTRIQGTDVSWTDLTLDFLWWPGARITGRGDIKGRSCHVLDVPAPQPARAPATVYPAADGTNAPPADADPGYAFVRIWVDRELFVMMQAEAYNAAGTRVRKLWVQSLKKQGGRWMIKDLEVQAYPPLQRTRLRVRDVETLDPA